MKKSELVFIPPPSISHLIPTIQIAKRLINRDDRISVTILCMKSPLTPSVDTFAKSLVSSETQIKLIDVPYIGPPPSELLTKSLENYIYVEIENHIPPVRDILKNIVSNHPTQVSGLVLDFFCLPFMDVAHELNLPSYMFSTFNLRFLAFILHLPTHHNLTGSEFNDSDPDVVIPGFVNPVPPRVFPDGVKNGNGGYTTYIKLARRLRETNGIFVNSFVELESHDALRSSIDSDGKTPPIYMVGPVVDLKGRPHPSMDRVQRENIMRWLDEQPDSSILYLCFGSHGHLFGASQLRQIALGIERSGYRFLWCIRSQQQTDKRNTEEIPLPKGFLERTEGIGMICQWAPQVEVLSHKAIGGFVSHCGWSSILESLWCGVPLATWPTGAEQQLNAFGMVRELGLAVELRLDYRYGEDVVMAEEIEMAVRRLMEDKSELRKKVKDMSKLARNVVAEGGSSFNALGQLAKDVIAGGN